MSRDLYRHATLLSCAIFHWNQTIRLSVAEYDQKTILIWQPPAILNLKKCLYLVIWLSSSSKCAVVYQISSELDDLPLRYGDFTLFSRWQISAILNLGPIMCSLKNPCRTCYWSSIETIALYCLYFENIAFLVWILATDRRTNKWTEPMHKAAGRRLNN